MSIHFSPHPLYFYPSVYMVTGKFLGKLTNFRRSTNKAMQQHTDKIHVSY